MSSPGWFLVPPTLAVLVGFPLLSLPFSGDPRGVLAPYTLIALPVYVALVAAPGYVACVTGDAARLHARTLTRYWVRASLLLATACSAIGIWAGSLMILFAPPAIVTAICSIVLWWRFERAGAALRATA